MRERPRTAFHDKSEVAMKKATINYWVDMITGVAFLFVAVTGLLRLFPEATVSMSAAGQPVILGISTSVWQVVHDWSGVVMAAGVGVHTALHLRWLIFMTGKLARGNGATGRPKATPSPRPQADTAGSLARLESMGTTRGSHADSRPRYTRKGFLAAAGVVGAGALLAGWGLLGRSDESAAVSTYGADASGAGDDDWAYGRRHGSENDASAGAAGDGTATASARVVVDAEACTGCGACVQVCPDAVFAMSGGKAVVRNADACRLCGRCTRVCAPAAITLNG